MKQVAVIGASRWGRHILRTLATTLSDHITIAQIGYRGSTETEAFLKLNYPHIPRTTSRDDIIHNPTIEAICIATPIPTHAEITESALRAEKHVFIEKPLARTLDQVMMLHDIATSKNLVLMTDYLYLADPDLEKNILMPTREHTSHVIVLGKSPTDQDHCTVQIGSVRCPLVFLHTAVFP
jgi:predicted dehydrogenase